MRMRMKSRIKTFQETSLKMKGLKKSLIKPTPAHKRLYIFTKGKLTKQALKSAAKSAGIRSGKLAIRGTKGLTKLTAKQIERELRARGLPVGKRPKRRTKRARTIIVVR